MSPDDAKKPVDDAAPVAVAKPAPAKTKKAAAPKKPRVKVPSTDERNAAKAYFGFAEDFRLTRDQEIQLVAVAHEIAPQMATAAAAAQAGETQVARDRQQMAGGGKGGRGNSNAQMQHDAQTAGKLSKGLASLQGEVRDKVLAILTEKQRTQLGFAGWQPPQKKEKGEAPPDPGKKPKPKP